MTERKTGTPRPRTDGLMICGRQRGNVTEVQIPNAQLIFHETFLIAAIVGAVVYFPEPKSPAQQRVLNGYGPDLPHVRLAAAEFDFVVGAALSTAGLPLTRLKE